MYLQVGVKLFPSFLAADQDIAFKNDQDGSLLILVVHSGQTKAAEMVEHYLKNVQTIRNVPLQVHTVHLQDIQKYNARIIGGVFLAQPLENSLGELVEFCKIHKTLLFSPFKADVERGALGGMLITDKVQPLINRATMDESGIRIKSFFLKVAKLL
ncbi:MAG: hypothetical protein G8345_22045 [Magnetococcales bacterium]|nr:hypothetical protein [Magnetococcales bacterium]NGZ29558.1 hypothetical protein [Magnetococcales bacterium]